MELHERKSRLHGSLKAMDEESKYLETYKQEKELIEQEKLAHAEELRLIHTDLHQMESIIQESETEADHHLTLARSLMLEWQQLADRANKMRSSLGLEKLTSLPEEEKLRSEFTKSSDRNDIGFAHSNQTRDLINGFKPLLMIANQHQSNQQHPFLFPSSTASSSRDYKPSLLPSSSAIGLSSLINPIHGPPSGLMSTGSSSSISERPSNRSFCQQQPAPMKSCLTCLQQIHRNAPICPNCKAKSRSKNPKKPKRKTED